jgi:hypothetical protein
LSPFDSAIEILAGRIDSLARDLQIVFFACAAEALVPRYLDWCADAGVEMRDGLLLNALDESRRIVGGYRSANGRSLLEQLAAAAPAEPTDAAWFTAAQDCWICADTSLRISVEGYKAADATWFVLEPLFQKVSEDLFGFSQASTEMQDESEELVLQNARLVAAIAAVDEAISIFSSGPITDELVSRAASVLTAIRP